MDREGGAAVASARLRVQRPIARRVLASFAVTMLAFAVTVGWAIVAQRRAADDSVELAQGYVPVALKIGQLRATHSTLTSLVAHVPDEKNPVLMRVVMETMVAARRAKLAEARTSVTQGLAPLGSRSTREKAARFAAELDSLEAALSEDKPHFERLFAAIASGDEDAINRTAVTLGAIEHDAEKRLRALADELSESMGELSAAAYTRERRAVYALAILAVLTLAVGIGVSVQAQRLLAPLAALTARAQAVGRGDLEPRPVVARADEIGELSTAFEKMVTQVARAQALALSNERLAAIGKMAAHVTHEIRNPLSSIGLNLELLDEELGSTGARQGEAATLLSAIQREVQRLEHLSEEYLRVARLPQPRMEADDVAAAVQEVVDFARPEIEHAGCTVATHVATGLPPALFDEGQLRQALLNLLRNGREAMPNGGEIDVRVLADGMSVCIAVEDRGGGIPDEIRSRVFDPFFSTKGEGTGLGLAITRHIVEAHGGTVTCETREGGGTRFKISLPIAPGRPSAPTSGSARAGR